MEVYLEMCKQQAKKWRCQDCALYNDNSLNKCAACETDRHRTSKIRNSDLNSNATIPLSSSTDDPRSLFSGAPTPMSAVDPRSLFGAKEVQVTGSKSFRNIAIEDQKKSVDASAAAVFSTQPDSKKTVVKNTPPKRKEKTKSLLFGDHGRSLSKGTSKKIVFCSSDEINSRSPKKPKFVFGFQNMEQNTQESTGKKKNLFPKEVLNSDLSHKLEEMKKGETALIAFGNNSFGSLALGPDAEPVIETPTVVEKSLGKKFLRINCGSLCSAAVDRSGCLWTWGPNDGGVLGRNTSENSDLESIPMKVKLPARVSEFSVGDEHMAVILSNGDLYSWGSFKDLRGRVGHHVKNGKIVKVQSVPYKMASPNNCPFIHLSSGANHVAVIDHTRQVFAFGITNFSQKTNLRRDDKMNCLDMKRIYSFPPYPKLKMASIFCGTHTIYGLDQNHAPFSFGLDNFGQLGKAKPLYENPKFRFNNSLRPIGNKKEFKIENSALIGGGNHHAVLLTKDKEIYTFGRNASGLLGRETPLGKKEFEGVEPESQHSTEPKKISLKATKIAVGSDHNLAVRVDGSLVGWGFNSDFRLGIGNEDSVPVGEFPVIFSDYELEEKGLRIEDISAGSQFSMVLLKKN